MIKLILSDIDGTLLNEKLQYSERLVKVIGKARSQGVDFGLATGRMYVSALHFAKRLKVTVPMICYNGGYIREIESGKVLFQSCIQQENANKILRVCRERGWHVQYYLDDELYCSMDSEYIRSYSKLSGVPYKVLGEDFYNLDQPTHKLLIIDERAEGIIRIKDCLQEVSSEVDFTSSKESFLEIIPKNVNKGMAVSKLADYLGINLAEIMAVGDSYNDLEMLNTVGLGVAMGNASNDIMHGAKAITDTNEQDGLAKAIEKYVLGC